VLKTVPAFARSANFPLSAVRFWSYQSLRLLVAMKAICPKEPGYLALCCGTVLIHRPPVNEQIRRALDR
jgi:hypothetical protein